MSKTQTTKKVRVRVREKTVGKQFPTSRSARLTVLLNGFKKHAIKLGVAIDLNKLKIDGKPFASLTLRKKTSAIGPTTRGGLLKYAKIACKMVSCLKNKNLWNKVVFSKIK